MLYYTKGAFVLGYCGERERERVMQGEGGETRQERLPPREEEVQLNPKDEYSDTYIHVIDTHARASVPHTTYMHVCVHVYV